MRSFFTKQVIAAILILSLFLVGLILFIVVRHSGVPVETIVKPVEEISGPVHKVIGMSVERREIEAYTYGKGKSHLVFIGGMHGGYEWNSVLLAYKFIDYFNANPKFIPTSMTITVIPSVNPDGVYKVVGKAGRFSATDASTDKETLASGRFNAHGVDLNRNFDCKWKSKSMWQAKIVSAGTAPFSEPEVKAIRNFVLENNPDAVIFWHSQANAVYASECKDGVLPKTLDIMNAYSRAAGYPAVKSFDTYEITGDSEGWLASVNIPAITVELKTHETTEWNQNLAGVKALFNYYGK